MKAPEASRALDAWRNERGFPVLTPPQVQRLRAGVRARNVKRVASAVGEGSIAVSFIHKVLQRS